MNKPLPNTSPPKPAEHGAGGRVLRALAAGLLCVGAGIAAESGGSGIEAARAADGRSTFSRCLTDLQAAARDEGVSRAVVDEVLGAVEFQPRVIELDRAQPEFRQSFSAYLRDRVTATRIARGRALMAEHRQLLSRLTAEYGVPGRYLVALWGMETNYGSFLGEMPTLDSLATLACDPRRSSLFTAELIRALKLLERESLDPARMRGSWAGAMGHTQFMPSAYFEHAVDGDGDGRVDLWRSPADALASAASYLRALGWRRGERWGREVLLPEGFAYAETGLENAAPLAHWRALGVRRADGGALPSADLSGAVIVPMGRHGPAFLVYPNFEVIAEWNRSQSYAIAVGHLADRIVGGGPLVGPLPEIETMPSQARIRQMQQALNALGFDAGEPDGIAGPVTRSALRAFQQASGMVADGYPDKAVIQAVLDAQAPLKTPASGVD